MFAVKHLQESHASFVYSEQGALKATSSGRSSGGGVGGGRSQLEEDGAMMPRVLHDVY